MTEARNTSMPAGHSHGLAILGLGHVALHQMAALERLEHLDLVAAHDIAPSRRALVPPHVPFVTSLDELLGLEGVDLYLVATPTRTHFELAMELLRHGRNVVLEKPMCMTSSEMDALLREAESGTAFFDMALHAEHGLEVHHVVAEYENILDTFGPLTGFECGFYDPYIVDESLVPGAASLVNPWLDSAINALSVVGRFLPPHCLDVHEGTAAATGEHGVFPQASAKIAFDHNGVTGHGIIDTNWSLGLNRKTTALHFGQTRTTIHLDHSEETVRCMTDGKLTRDVRLTNGRQRLENHYFNVFGDLAERFDRAATRHPYLRALHEIVFSGPCS